MKIAVVVFPGSNCDIDIYEALHTVCGADVEYVSHKRDNLDGFDAVMLPGDFPMVITCAAVRLLGLQTSCLQSSKWLMKASLYLARATVFKFLPKPVCFRVRLSKMTV